MDGRPAVVLVVRYMKRKQIEEVRLDTGTSERERFPIGYTVAFRFSNGQPVLVPNSVSQKKLRHEEGLMNPDLGPGQKASS